MGICCSCRHKLENQVPPANSFACSSLQLACPTVANECQLLELTMRPLQESVEVMQACIKEEGATPRSCALQHYEGKPQQLVKGMYSVFMPDWQAAYREDQMLVLNTDTYRCAQHAWVGCARAGRSQCCAAVGLR